MKTQMFAAFAALALAAGVASDADARCTLKVLVENNKNRKIQTKNVEFMMLNQKGTWHGILDKNEIKTIKAGERKVLRMTVDPVGAEQMRVRVLYSHKKNQFLDAGQKKAYGDGYGRCDIQHTVYVGGED